MKTARLLFAALSLATLAACGGEPITGASPEDARREIAPGTGGATIQSASKCSKVVVTVDAYGNTVETCADADRGPGIGSGS